MLQILYHHNFISYYSDSGVSGLNGKCLSEEEVQQNKTDAEKDSIGQNENTKTPGMLCLYKSACFGS